MKTCIVTCLNNRPHISRILFDTWKRLDVTGTVISIAAAVTEDEDARLCEKYKVPFVQVENVAGAKWNAALKLAMSDPRHTHFLIMGDDDSLSLDGYNRLFRAASQGEHYVGFKSNGFYDMLSGKAMTHTQPYQANKLIGAGRLISRFAIESVTDKCIISWRRDYMSYHPGDEIEISRRSGEYLQGYNHAKVKENVQRDFWNPVLRKGLDNDSEMRLVMAGFAPVAVDDGRIHVTDFKSKPEDNIWPYSHLEQKLRCYPCEKNKVLWYLSQKELDYIYNAVAHSGKFG
jgi:hypothetical protein